MVHVFKIPGSHLPDFDSVWNLHPNHRETIKLFGKESEVPRWQQAYLKQYTFSNKDHQTPKETPEVFLGLLDLMQKVVSPKLNGILVNWYNPEDYIGLHSDDEKNLLKGEPIVTMVLMEQSTGTRTFQLVPKGEGVRKDYELGHGDVLVMCGETQTTHKHGVPKRKKNTSKRISITFRCF